jgi:hypothetical protein
MGELVAGFVMGIVVMCIRTRAGSWISKTKRCAAHALCASPQVPSLALDLPLALLPLFPAYSVLYGYSATRLGVLKNDWFLNATNELECTPDSGTSEEKTSLLS